MARRSPSRKVKFFEPVPPRLERNTIIESRFEVIGSNPGQPGRS